MVDTPTKPNPDKPQADTKADVQSKSTIKHPDNPIKSTEDDLLGRSEFAKHLADSILNWEKEESLVIGINAKWGDGKSSVINMAVEEIEQKNTNKESKASKDKKKAGAPATKDTIIINFNPWVFADSNNLGKLFFAEISDQLESKGGKALKKVIDTLRDYSVVTNLAAPTVDSALGVPPGTLANIAKPAITIGSKLLNINKDKSQSEQDLKKKVAEAIEQSGKKILVIIDDIDRLTGDEIKQILRLVRVNGDFPHMMYLLAFDSLVVESILKDDKQTSGKDYLDKIIQVNFNLPAINKNHIRGLLTRELDGIIKTLPQNSQKYFDYEANDNRWKDLTNNHFFAIFNNIRDIKRFINGLSFNLAHINDSKEMEVNPVDFILLEIIRVFAPTLYYFISQNRYMLTYINRGSGSSVSYAEEFNKSINKAVDEIPQIIQKHAKFFLKELFPQIRYYTSDALISKTEAKSWEQDHRICSQESFYYYFTLSAKDIEFTEDKILNIVNGNGTVGQVNSNIMGIIYDRRLPHLITSIDRVLESSEKIKSAVNEHRYELVNTLMRISDDDAEGLEDDGTNNLIAKIIVKLIWDDPNINIKAKIKHIKEYFDKTDYLLMPFHVLSNIKGIEDETKQDISMHYFKLLKRLGISKVLHSSIAKEIIHTLSYVKYLDTTSGWSLTGSWPEDDILSDEGYLLRLLRLCQEKRGIGVSQTQMRLLDPVVNVDVMKEHLDMLSIDKPDLNRADHKLIKQFMEDYKRFNENGRMY